MITAALRIKSTYTGQCRHAILPTSATARANHIFAGNTDSEISNESDYDPIDESFGERLYALRDIIPPQTRASISNGVNNTTDAVKSVLSFGGKTLWVIATSAMLLGVPWALAFAEEQQVMDMEREMKMREMGGEVSSAPKITR